VPTMRTGTDLMRSSTRFSAQRCQVGAQRPS
jgi:hypothetical protein